MEKSFLQRQAELATFDAHYQQKSKIQETIQYQNDDDEMSTFINKRYDPDHKDADWSGEIPQISRKKMVNESIRHEKPISSKRIFKNDIRYQGLGAETKESPLRTAVYQMGPGGKHNCEDWKTTSQMQNEVKKSKPEILGTNGVAKGNFISQGKRISSPLYESYSNKMDSSGTKEPLSFRNKSLLSGIGQRVSEATRDLKSPQYHSSRGFTDPSKKVLVAENLLYRKSKRT